MEEMIKKITQIKNGSIETKRCWLKFNKIRKTDYGFLIFQATQVGEVAVMIGEIIEIIFNQNKEKYRDKKYKITIRTESMDYDIFTDDNPLEMNFKDETTQAEKVVLDDIPEGIEPKMKQEEKEATEQLRQLINSDFENEIEINASYDV